MVKAVQIDYIDNINWSVFTPDHPNYKKWFENAMEYARTEIDQDDFKGIVANWYQKNQITKLELLKHLESWQLKHVGKYFWLIEKGAQLKSETMDWLFSNMDSLLEQAKLKQHEFKENKVVVKKKAYTTEQLGRFIAQDLEDLVLTNEIDQNPDSAYELLVKIQPKSTILKSTIAKLNEFVEELLSFTSDEIQEGYPSKEAYENSLKNYRILLQSAKTYQQNSKRSKKSSKKTRKSNIRAQKVDKIVENVKFKLNDSDLKLVSIEPTNLLGARHALIYNTKTRKLGLYYALNKETGFEIRGTTIHGYDPDKSFQKILRDPKKQIESFRKTTTKRVEVVLNDYIKAKSQPLNGRLNEHTLIIQVWK